MRTGWRDDPRRVLLIEDSPTDVLLFERVVQDMQGWEVVAVNSLEGARSYLERHHEDFDVVVVDLSLPDAVALDSVEFASSAQPDAACVVMTGDYDEAMAQEALRHGATDFLRKIEISGQAIRRALRYAYERNVLRRMHRSAEMNLRQVLRSLPASVFVLNDDGQVLFANRPAKQLLGNMAKGPSALTHLVEDLQTGVLLASIETHGGRLPIEVTATQVDWSGAGRARALVVRSLVSENEAEELRRQLRRKEEQAQAGYRTMLGLHDFAGKVEGLLELLRASGNAPALAQAEDMAQAFRDLRREAKGVRALHNPVELNTLAESCLNQLVQRLDQDVVIELRRSDKTIVHGDAAALERVILNLLDNALEAVQGNPEAMVLLEVIGSGDRIGILVGDNGPGIPASQLPRIFEPHYTTKEEGTGLGLASVKDIVSDHGGEVNLESTLGEGTVFKVYLPRANEAPVPQKEQRMHAGPCVLVDDQNLVRRAVSRSLRTLGHEVVALEGGEALVEWLEQTEVEPSYILCDRRMPGMNGESVFAWLKAHRPELVSRFVLVSGDGEFGIDAFEGLVHRLDKPVDIYDLKAIVGAGEPVA